MNSKSQSTAKLKDKKDKPKTNGSEDNSNKNSNKNLNGSANASQWRPLLSLFFITLTLLLIVFLQMEERRIGYQILRDTKEFKRFAVEFREKEIAFAKVTRPQLLESLAQRKFTLKKLQSNQVIHLTGASFPNSDEAPVAFVGSKEM